MEKTRSASGCLCSCYYRHHILYRLHKMHGAETLSASWNPSSKNKNQVLETTIKLSYINDWLSKKHGGNLVLPLLSCIPYDSYPLLNAKHSLLINTGSGLMESLQPSRSFPLPNIVFSSHRFPATLTTVGWIAALWIPIRMSTGPIGLEISSSMLLQVEFKLWQWLDWEWVVDRFTNDIIIVHETMLEITCLLHHTSSKRHRS